LATEAFVAAGVLGRDVVANLRRELLGERVTKECGDRPKRLDRVRGG
jgi:hypothetical protein